MWQKYYELEPIRRLKNEGRELLGKHIILTEKRDGENVSIWLDDNLEPHVSSHNMVNASENIISRFKSTPEYEKAVELLKDDTQFENHLILYGELLLHVGPTRVEPKRKHLHWVLFDIYDIVQERYLTYGNIYQKAYHYKIPIVKNIYSFSPYTIEELQKVVDEYLKYCKRHRREGFVGKDYFGQIFFKEKIDLPKLNKVHRLDKGVVYPAMPTETILRALQHAYDIVGEADWRKAIIAMPIVAQQFTVEAKEHNYATPRNMYLLWINTPIEQIKGNGV